MAILDNLLGGSPPDDEEDEEENLREVQDQTSRDISSTGESEPKRPEADPAEFSVRDGVPEESVTRDRGSTDGQSGPTDAGNIQLPEQPKGVKLFGATIPGSKGVQDAIKGFHQSRRGGFTNEELVQGFLTEQAQEQRELAEEQAARGDTLGFLGSTGKVLQEVVLDSPFGSVQEASQAAGVTLTGAESDEELARMVQSAAMDAQEGSVVPPDLLPDQEVQVAGPVTFNPQEAGDVTGSISGSVFENFVVAPVNAGFAALTGIEPLPGYEPGLLSSPEREDAPTGETEATPATEEYIFDVVGLGTAARGASKADEAASVLDDLSGASGSAQTTATMPIFDDLLIRGADEAPRILDDAPNTIDDLAGMSFDEFVGKTPTRVDESPGALRGSTTFRESQVGTLDIQRFFDETPGPRVDDAGMGPRSADDADFVDEIEDLDAETLESLNVGDEVGFRTVDEVLETFEDPSRILEPRSGDDVITSLEVDESGSLTRAATLPRDQFDALRRGEDFVPDEGASIADNGGPFLAGDEIASRFQDSFTRFLDEFGSGGDEATSLADEPFSAGDEAVETFQRGADDVGEGALRAGDDVADESGGLFTLRNAAIAGGATGLAGVLGGLGFTAINDGSAGDGEGGGGGGTSGSSSIWDGSLTAPRSVAAGQGFNAEASVRNTTNQSHTASFVLAVSPEGDENLYRISSKRVSLEGRGGQTLSFQASSMTQRLPAGQYRLVLLAQGEGQGRIASRGLTVEDTGGGNDNTDVSEWGEVSMVGELGAGWYLAEQRKKDGSDVRYIVVGQTSDGTRMYLTSGGRTVRSPNFFDTQEAAVQAFQAWRSQQESGSGEDGGVGGGGSTGGSPSPSGGRPSPQDVQQDAARRDAGPLGFVKRNPVATTGFVLMVAALWYYSDGEPVEWLKSQYRNLRTEVM